jgi:hypothetical protein
MGVAACNASLGAEVSFTGDDDEADLLRVSRFHAIQRASSGAHGSVRASAGVRAIIRQSANRWRCASGIVSNASMLPALCNTECSACKECRDCR